MRASNPHITTRILAGALVCAAAACDAGHAEERPSERRQAAAPPAKVGVLLVNHGSRSETWRNALLDLEQRVEPEILRTGAIADVRTAFMEYTEPSIATRLREYDAAGFTDVILVPVFLTVSSHSFDDIPTIIGQKEDPAAVQTLGVEGIARYTPRARAHVTPLLDFTDIVQKNVLRRVQQLSSRPADEGLVLIAYGDQTYEREWDTLLEGVGRFVGERTGITEHSHGWCGHLVHYEPARTTEAIQRVLATKPKAIVVPVLVAHDEMFQIRIIGDGIAAVPSAQERVAYRPDAILPDRDVERWVVDIVRRFSTRLAAASRG